MSLQSQFKTSDKAQRNSRTWSIFYCTSCGGVLTVSSNPSHQNGFFEIFPSFKGLDGSIPEKALSFLSQAMETIHAPSASIMVACSALDEMLKQKGLREGKLYPRIKKAAENHLITPEMETWAHEIRLEANDQRHADESVALPTMDDAKRVLDFVLALAEFLFVLPSRVRKGISDAKAE
ncbi:hypothetical protein DDT91_14565 [Algoriphagus sp. AK58]|nr:hypothetical protein [Algoriphagus sp. AK58]